MIYMFLSNNPLSGGYKFVEFALFDYTMTVKLLAEHHLEFLSLTGGCIGSSEYTLVKMTQSTLVKMTHCWKSHAAAQMC